MCQHAQIHESDISVWICMFTTDWSVNISVRAGLSTSVCVSRHTVCMSELIPVCYGDIPGGKEPRDRFHSLHCPYLFMSTGSVKVTSDFIQTQWGSLRLSVSFYVYYTRPCCFPKWVFTAFLRSVSLRILYTFQFFWLLVRQNRKFTDISLGFEKFIFYMSLFKEISTNLIPNTIILHQMGLKLFNCKMRANSCFHF